MYYSPVRHSSSEEDSFDLHVLGTPPAFILSQDRTLKKVFDHLIFGFQNRLAILRKIDYLIPIYCFVWVESFE